jgi:S-adenosylmethionine hydrolase
VITFRSFEFIPRAAKWLTDGLQLPYKPYAISNTPDAPASIWFVDNFGNCKTTLRAEDVAFETGKQITTTVGPLTCYNRLKDVPDHQPALIIGSSGYNEDRFLELVIQGKNAAKQYNLTSGSLIF